MPKIRSTVDPTKAIVRHGRPSIHYRLSLLPKPTKAHYDSLVEACVAAIIADESVIYVSFSHLFIFPKDFPKGYLVSRDGPNNIRKIVCKYMLKWLQDNGHTTVTAHSISGQRRKFSKLLAMMDNIVDLDQNNEYDLDIETEEE